MKTSGMKFEYVAGSVGDYEARIELSMVEAVVLQGSSFAMQRWSSMSFGSEPIHPVLGIACYFRGLRDIPYSPNSASRHRRTSSSPSPVAFRSCA